MKLQYKNNQWVDAETGIEIAPQDQEKVTFAMWWQSSPDKKEKLDGNGRLKEINFDDWQPEEGKLYDSGDLVFELKTICPRTNWFIQTKCKSVPSGQECDCELEQFWVLKEKAKEECKKCGLHKNECRCSRGELSKEDGKESLSPLQIAVYAVNCENEDHYADEIAQMIVDYSSGQIKQLQDRIKELEALIKK